MTVVRRWPTCISLATFGRRVVDDDDFGRRRRLHAEARRRPRWPASWSARNASSNVTLMKPGPATSSVAICRQVGGGDDVVGDLARVAAELLGERQRAVGLRVGAVAGAHDGVDIARSGDRARTPAPAGRRR